MSLVLTALLAVSPLATPTLPTCSWNQPGHNPFMGDVVAAVDRYQDIPAAQRARLKSRMAARQYDEIVSIRRDGIVGRARYGAEIRDMHFGTGQVCGTVNRAAWRNDAQERGLVYCEGEHCILVPTVCRNVSRITRTAPAQADTPAVAGAGASRGDTATGAAGGAGGAGAGVAQAAPATAGATPAGSDTSAAAAGGVPADAAAGVGGASGGGGASATGWSVAGGSGGAGAAGVAGGAAGGGASWAVLAAAGGVAAAALADPAMSPAERLIAALPGTARGPLTDVSGPATDGLLAVTTPPVPEPGTWALWAAGLALLAVRRARRARAP